MKEKKTVAQILGTITAAIMWGCLVSIAIALTYKIIVFII